MTVKLGALIVRNVPQDKPLPSPEDKELVETLRFFEGLGKPLSTWEMEMLGQAESLQDPEGKEEMRDESI